MFIAPACENSTMGYLWYLITLFVIFLFVMFLGRLHIDLKNPISCVFILVISVIIDYHLPKIEWLNLSAVFHYFPYFIIGILYKHYEFKSSISLTRPVEEKGKEKDNLNYRNLIGLGKLLVYIFLSVYIMTINTPYSNNLKIVRAIIGILMSIQLCVLLLDNKWIRKFVQPMSKYTYSIYLLSWFGQYAVKIIVVNMLNLHWLFVVLFMFIAGIIIPIWICKIVEGNPMLNKKKWLRLVIGY